MNRYLSRFVSCLLVPALIGADPSWAMGIAPAAKFHSSILHPAESALFVTEAVVEPLAGGFVGNIDAVSVREEAAEKLHLPVREGMSRREALAGIAGLITAPMAALAQQQRKKKPQTAPVVTRQDIPQAPVVERQNRLLTDAQWRDAWHFEEDSTDPRSLKNQLPVVANNSTKVGQKFYAHREAWESFLAIRADDGKYATNRSDQLHGAGAGTSQPTIGQVLSYPGVSATQPKRQVETADFEPVDKSHPGFLHWQTLAQVAARALRVALEGVQFYSKNQVEMSYLQEHAAAFKVREAYVDIEEAVHEDHEAAIQAWLDYAVRAQKPAELRETAWIETRARDREKLAAPQEGRPLTEFYRLQGTSDRAVVAYHAAHNDLEPLRIHWLETVGHTENDVSREASASLRPQGIPVWPMSRDLFILADAVAPLIAKEQAAANVFAPETLPLPPAGEWDASRPSLPDGSYAPDSFPNIPGGAVDEGEIDETVASELELLFTAIPVDAPLGTSPRQRWLKLQNELIETVQMEMLELQKLPTWNVGAHVDLGTQPFIASLLNWDYRRPGRNKILSLGELQIELALRMQEIDQEVIGDLKHNRDLWLEARARRQTALAELVAVRNQIATDQAQRAAAVWALQNGDGKTSADPITPALQIEQLKREYARHLTEAWSAWQLMQLYTVEGRERVVAETFAHYSRVMKKIDPDYDVTPEQLNPALPTQAMSSPVDTGGAPMDQNNNTKRQSILRRLVPKILKSLGAIVPALLITALHLGTATVSSAHTFVAQTAGAAAQATGHLVTGGAAQQVAMDVVVGRYQGGPENSLSGMAVNILRALHPEHHGLFSPKEVSNVVGRIMQDNGIPDPRHMKPGLYHIGSFDLETAKHLRAHVPNMVSVSPATIPHVQVASPPPQAAPMPVQPAPAAPAPATLPTHHGNGLFDSAHRIWDSLEHAIQFAWQWTWMSPTHYIPVLIFGIAVITYIWMRARKGNLVTNGGPYRPFSTNGPVKKMRALGLLRTWGPVLVLAPAVLKWFLPMLQSAALHIVSHRSSSPGGSFSPFLNSWGIPAVILFIGVTLAGFLPAIRDRPFLRRIFPPAAAVTAILLVPGLTPWMRLLGFVLAWGIFFIPGIRQIGRSRWAPLAAIPLLLVGLFVGGQRAGIPEKVRRFASERATTYALADTLSANPGVSLQPVPPLPAIWAVGPHTGGVITGVKQTIAPGDLAVALEPIDEGLADRLHAVNNAWFELYGSYLIAPDRIAAVTRKHDQDAFVRIKPHFETSYDKTISDILDQIEGKFIAHDMAVAVAREDEKATGAFVLSFDAKIQRFQLMKLGLDVTANLLARNELNVPFKRRPALQPGTGTVAVGTSVQDHGRLTLFTQALPEDDLLQVKMSPRDVRALIHQWRKNPSGAAMKLKAADGTFTDIPFHSIEFEVAPNDPTLGIAAEEENLQGGLTNNPALGAAPTITVNVMVRHPGRTLNVQLADVSKRYDFQGIYAGPDRVVEAGPDFAIGTISAAIPPAAQRPQKTLLEPIEEQLNATEALISAYQALEREVEQFQRDFPERGSAPVLLADYRARQQELKSQAENLRRRREEIQASGMKGTINNIQALDPFRRSHYALENPFPTDSPDEGEFTWTDPVLLQVSFYATPETIPTGNDVEVRIPGTDRYVTFHKAGYRSLDRTKDVRLYFLRTELPVDQARQFFPPDLPMTVAHAEIKLPAAPPSLASRVRDIFRPAAGAGPARLTGRELFTALAWVAAVAFAAFTFGIDPHALAASLGGLAVAVGTHEFVGHGMSALRNVRRPTRLRRVGGNLEWQEQSPAGVWQTLLNRKVQKAGPRASRILAAIGFPLLLVQTILGLHVVYPMLIIYAVVASVIFRHADRAFEISEEDRDLLRELDAPSPLPVPERLRPWNHPEIGMTHEKLSALSLSLQNTVLEEERYWYKDQKTTYLTMRQKIWDVWILRRARVRLMLPKLFYRRFVRDNVTNRQSSLIYDHWQLTPKEGAASAKTRTFQWVHLALAAGAIYLLLAGPDAIRDFVGVLRANPMFLFAFDARNVPGMLLGIIVGMWILLAALESLGKLFSTLRWNLSFYKHKTLDRFSSAEERFKENTGREAAGEFTKMADARILLKPEVGPGKTRRLDDEYNQFLDNLQQFADLVTAATLEDLNQDDPRHPSEESLSFENTFRIQASRSRFSPSPIYRGKLVPLASEADLAKHVSHAHPDFRDLPEEEQYRLMTNARVDEAKRLAELYPMHTLVALLRSGNTELLARIGAREGGGLILEIVEQLKERLNSLDDDAFDDLRAQERFDDFFDTLHYVYEGLCRPVTLRAERTQRSELLQFLSQAVAPFERGYWAIFQRDLDDLAAHDPNLVRGIAYVLTARLLKENESQALQQLEELRHQIPHSRSDVHHDRYLRNEAHAGSTSVIQLKMAYQKYFDLLKEFGSRFPGIRLLGSRNIYILCEDTINFRQTLREIALILPLVGGKIYLVNVAETHNDFANRLNKAVSERFSWKDRGRIQVRSIEVWNVWKVQKTWFGTMMWPSPWALLRSLRGELFVKRMRNDKNGVILSSATPVEWRNVRQSIGAKVYGTSPLLKLALFAGLVRELSPGALALVVSEVRHHIADQYRILRERKDALADMAHQWTGLQEAGLQQSSLRKVEALSTGNWLRRLGQRAPLSKQAVSLSSAQEDLDHVQEEIDALAGELDDLNYLEYEFNNVSNFLPLINLRLQVLHNNDPLPTNPPIFVPENPLDPNYVLDTQAYVIPGENNSGAWHERWVSGPAARARNREPRAGRTAA